VPNRFVSTIVKHPVFPEKEMGEIGPGVNDARMLRARDLSTVELRGLENLPITTSASEAFSIETQIRRQIARLGGSSSWSTLGCPT